MATVTGLELVRFRPRFKTLTSAPRLAVGNAATIMMSDTVHPPRRAASLKPMVDDGMLSSVWLTSDDRHWSGLDWSIT
ncbi:hypothetical protein Pla52o_58130 [Novipirellula galeiformis]|uniref:Uncharacterized protein n=1 Tax=Novipirellula galeiformis TaxID=2528004 RepID=A0A5C6BHH5_9BACT|nr:hypothetical protein Pla52o_58130 [Novipirellula galeiformis]